MLLLPGSSALVLELVELESQNQKPRPTNYILKPSLVPPALIFTSIHLNLEHDPGTRNKSILVPLCKDRLECHQRKSEALKRDFGLRVQRLQSLECTVQGLGFMV